MEPVVTGVLGLLLGLGLGALAVAALLRATGRITGARGSAILGLAVDGLRPGRRDGVGTQRALARQLKRTGERTASGRHVAATDIELHLGPEDHQLIEDSIGVDAATADLVDFYTAYTREQRWHVPAAPRIVLVRDISLRPRQSYARADVRAAAAQERPVPAEERRPRTGAVPVARPAAGAPTGARAAPSRSRSDTAPVPRDEAVTDVMPRAGVPDGEGPGTTRSYPIGMTDSVLPGDLVVVHGTDVRTVPKARGRVSIGRGAHNDMVIARPGVARDHIVVERRGHGWWVVPSTTEAAASLDGQVLHGPVRLDGQGLLEVGRGVRLRLTVESDG